MPHLTRSRREAARGHKSLTEGLAETSRSIDRVMLALLALALFSVLALGQPDALLLDTGATVNVPSIGAASAKALLVVGPLLLIGARVYLHIYVEHWRVLDREATTKGIERSKALSPMSQPVLRTTSWAVLYLLVPTTLAAYAWKALGLPRTWGFGLLTVTIVVTVAHVLLCVRRYWNVDLNRLFGASIIAVAITGIVGAYAVFGWNLRRPLDLRFAALSKTDLSGLDLRDADLRAAELIEADLIGANLLGANLTGASLEKADLRDAHLALAKLFSADLSGAQLQRANLSGAGLADADLSKAILTDVNLKGASLARVRMIDAFLAGADLRTADLEGATLLSADLRQANLEAVDLKGANLSNAVLIQANLAKARLSYADFSYANMWAANLSGAELIGVVLQGANLNEADLSGANLGSASLVQADLSSADLSFASLAHADLSGAIFRGAVLRGADFMDTTFHLDGPNLDDFDGACYGQGTYMAVQMDAIRITLEPCYFQDSGNAISSH